MKAKKIYINRKTDITVFINQAGYSHHIFHMRRGETFTRARASRKVTQARLSIERDDLTIYD